MLSIIIMAHFWENFIKISKNFQENNENFYGNYRENLLKLKEI